jgi:paraquat-inducible protein A
MNTSVINVACHDCDLLVNIDHVNEGDKAMCPRCGSLLTANHHKANDRIISFSIAALLFLLLSTLFPFLEFSFQGQDRTLPLLQSITFLISEKYITLVILTFVTVIIIPVLYLISAIYICVSLKSADLFVGTKTLLKFIGFIKNWNMAEIFLLGVMISYIKVVSLAEIHFGLSFWSYVLFILSMVMVVLHIDKYTIWKSYKDKKNIHAADDYNEIFYQSCHVCTDVYAITKKTCNTCGSKLHSRIKNSMQKTWALLITSVILFIPANMLPIMVTTSLGEVKVNTVVGGVIVLWESGSYPIAVIIFVASVIVPIGKILALSWLCYSVNNKSEKLYREKTQIYRVIELVGRWSIIDVFVVAILSSLITLGNVMNVYPGEGAVAFAVMVILTLLASLTFDPRLIWAPVNNEKNL